MCSSSPLTHSLPHCQHHAPEWHICYQRWTPLTHPNHPKSVLSLRVLSWCCALGRSGQCMMTCIPCYTVIGGVFTDWRLLCPLTIYPSLQQPPIFSLCLWCCLVQNAMYTWFFLFFKQKISTIFQIGDFTLGDLWCKIFNSAYIRVYLIISVLQDFWF